MPLLATGDCCHAARPDYDPAMARMARLSFASLSVLLFTIPVLQGCTPDEQPSAFGGLDELGELGALGTLYLDYLDLLGQVDRFYCDCEAQAGEFANVDECLAYIGGPTLPPLLADCYARTLDEYDMARDHIECQVTRFETLVECIGNTGCAGDLAPCEQQAFDTMCPDRPYEVEAAIAEQCLGYSLPPPFECGDGTKIMPWFECDFAADCPDGSDEYVECPGAFACADGQVIAQDWLCDGISDCAAGDDEANCP
jgi:hypothetical protein